LNEDLEEKVRERSKEFKEKNLQLVAAERLAAIGKLKHKKVA
jgi:hypothetical protein